MLGPKPNKPSILKKHVLITIFKHVKNIRFKPFRGFKFACVFQKVYNAF